MIRLEVKMLERREKELYYLTNSITVPDYIRDTWYASLRVALVDLIPDGLKYANRFTIVQAPDLVIQATKILDESLPEDYSPFTAIGCTIQKAPVTKLLSIGCDTRLDNDTRL